MTDNVITAVSSAFLGASVFTQAQSVQVPVSVSALISIFTVAGAALIAWGMLKKATQHNEDEIEELRRILPKIESTLADVRDRVSRIEGFCSGRGCSPD
jgi:hypothetical protein